MVFYAEAEQWEITGAFRGTARFEVNQVESQTSHVLAVEIKGVKLRSLSDYKDIRPLTGGDRVCVYFDTQPEQQGAEYCAFVYKGTVILKRHSRPGMFDVSIDELQVFSRRGSIFFWVPADSIKGDIRMIWTVQLKGRH